MDNILFPLSENTLVSASKDVAVEEISNVLVAALNPQRGFGVVGLTGLALDLFRACQWPQSVSFLATTFGLSEGELRTILASLTERGVLEVTGYDPPRFRANANGGKHKSTAIWLHITNRCNLRCPYCYICKSNAQMSWEVAKEVIDKSVCSCVKHGYQELLIKFAGGEPLMNIPLIRRVCCYTEAVTQETGFRFRFHVLTNGTFVTSKVADFLAECHSSVSVSMDGVGEYNDLTRVHAGGSGSFEEIDRGIDVLRSAGISPVILTVISDLNIAGLPELVRYCIERGLFFSLTPVRDTCLNWSERNQTFVDILQTCYDLMEAMLFQGIPVRHSFENLNLARISDRCCSAGWDYPVVGHNGDFSLCQTDIGGRFLCNVRQAEDVLGFVRSQSLLDFKEVPIDCKSCPWYYVCSGGCSLHRVNTFGSLREKSPYCSLYKSVIPRLIRLEAVRLQQSYTRMEEG